MKLQFFTIPAQESSQATIELNSFCSQHKINAIEKQFVNDGANSYWAICVTYIDSQDTLMKVSSSKSKKTIDYKEVLNDDDFTIYSQFVTFVNRQLSVKVRRPGRSSICSPDININ